jgi:hypothetical protein
MKRWLGFDSTFVINSRAGWAIPFNDISDFDLPGCATGLCQTFQNGQAELQPLTNIDTDLELPISERYFLGGVGPFQVRGFRQRSLGPRRTILNQTDPVTGSGDKLLFASGRDLAIDGSGRVTDVFCPAGSVCNSLRDTDIDDFEDLDLADVIGGNKFFLLNLELQFPLSEDLGLMGLVFDQPRRLPIRNGRGRPVVQPVRTHPGPARLAPGPARG